MVDLGYTEFCAVVLFLPLGVLNMVFFTKYGLPLLAVLVKVATLLGDLPPCG